MINTNLTLDALVFALVLVQETVIDQPAELSLEQEFHLKSFADQVQRMSREQAQEFLIMLYQQMMIRETMYRHFLRHEWNLESGKVFKLFDHAN